MSALTLAHGGSMIDLFPLVFLVAAVLVITSVLNEGKRRTRPVRSLPQTPIERQMRAALNGPRRNRPAEANAPGTRPPVRPRPRTAPRSARAVR